MAKKSKKASSSNDSNVVRIKATPSAPKKREVTTDVIVEKVEETKPTAPKVSKGVRGSGVLKSILGYFTGAWFELRQVRWPDRRATWSLTGAVLIYTAFFVILVLLLDALFKYLFELILGK